MESTTTIQLELRLEGDCLTGTALNGHGRREFTGWIGLLAAIDGLVGGRATFTAQEEPMSIEIAPPSLVQPGHAGFDQARQAFNLALEQRPELVARPADEREVIELVRYARANGLRIAPQRTGHNAGPIDWERPALLLRTDAMQGVTIDAAARTARVNAGVKWNDIVDDLSELGLAALHGSARDISIVGYSLGGGQGWLGRKHGLQANSVTAIELVTADGEFVRADHQNEPELFWALRGGGGNFGVVTALEFDLYPLAELYAGALLYDFERGGEVLHAWREVIADAPEEISSVFKLLQLPDLPEIPDPLRGNSFAVVTAAVLGGEADGSDFLEPLRRLGPAMDTFAMVPPAALSYLAQDPEDPLPYTSAHHLLGELPGEAVDKLIEVGGAGSGSPLLMIELRHLGGALARSGPNHGAYAAMNGEYILFALGAVMGPEAAPAMAEAVDRVAAAMEPWRSGWYLNFVERQFDMSRVFDAETWRRLQAVKAKVDPDGVFLSNHQITLP
jgi:FAD/FMN-containing dehydrogenase